MLPVEEALEAMNTFIASFFMPPGTLPYLARAEEISADDPEAMVQFEHRLFEQLEETGLNALFSIYQGEKDVVFRITRRSVAIAHFEPARSVLEPHGGGGL